MSFTNAIKLCAIVICAAIVLFPIYWMVMTAVLPTALTLSNNPPLVPPLSEISFSAFVSVYEDRPFVLWMLNSLGVGLVSTLISLAISTLAGYSLSRWDSKTQKALGATLLISKIVPPALIIIPLYIIFNTIGLYDTYIGLILAHLTIGIPLATWMLKGFFDRIPKEVDQAALIDGCTQLQLLRYIILPMAKPGLTGSGIYLLIVSWHDFIFARTLMRSQDHHVLNVGLQSFVGEHLVDWSGLMAAGTISLLPIIVLFVLLEPFLVGGMVKGSLAN